MPAGGAVTPCQLLTAMLNTAGSKLNACSFHITVSPGAITTNTNALALDLSRALDLTKADLKGANLSNLYLVGADLTGTDLTGADVQGTVFGDNEGLSELTKRDLERRGAIFQDSPDSNVPSLVRV